MKFNVNMLKEWDLPWAAKEDKIIGHSRWSVEHEIIFEYEGKFYQTTYSVGATESQDEGPWKYEKEVDCTEVKEVEKLVKVWEPVSNENS